MTWKKISLLLSLLSISTFGIFIGTKTHFFTLAYDQIRPQIMLSGGKACLDKLALKNIKFQSLGEVGPKNCTIKDAVKIENFPKTKLSRPINLNCKTSLSLANWLEEIEATEIEHFGSYNCRKIQGTNIMSEHSFGSAVDIASINGIYLRIDWKKNDDTGKYLRQAGKEACRYFANVLSPDYNAAHYDHFHLDNGYQRVCPSSQLRRIKRAALKFVANN